MEVIILAGGFGKRLQSVVQDVPKPMADINGRPFIAWLLDYFSRQWASRVFLSVGYKKESIMQYFGDRYKDMDIVYVREDEPLGTGGAIREALKSAHDDTIVVANGDSFLALDLPDMLRNHAAGKADLTIALKQMGQNDRYGTVLIKDSRAVGFLEKAGQRSGYINGGVYAMDRNRVLDLLDKQPRAFSFETDFLQKAVENINALVYITEGYFIDIGVPADYARAQKELGRYITSGA
jgi:D-glycero-alpha-D-manno-heptose 1-phosphate guanylyltransferase